jgi:hypothetical protein
MKAVAHLLYATQLVWILSVTLIKISVVLMLLRVAAMTRWATTLRFLIAILVATAVANMAIQFTACTPISAFWDPKPGAECRSFKINALASYATSGM